MAINAIERDFRSSKMATDNPIIKNNNNNSCLLPFYKNKSCVLIWNDRKWFSVIQNGPNRTSKMAVGGHLKKNCCILPFCEENLSYWSEMARNAIESDFRSSKMQPFWLTCNHFVNIFFQKSDWKLFSFIQNGHSGIYTVFALGQMHQF